MGEGEGAGVGDGLAVGVIEGLGLGVGVGDGEVVIVGTNVAEPLPGQVCESRIPESTVLIVARDPTWTMRSLSFVSV